MWERMTEVISPRKVWLLLDEWSSVPIELQPFLADLIRRSIFPVRGVVTKVAAIEQRSQFALPSSQGNYLGLEVGADAAADINLDDFMVFDNDASRARAFYRSLLSKHVAATEVIQESTLSLDSEPMFLRLAFTQVNTFDELVRASEGVPRDAINIVIQAAQYAGTEPISMEHIRRGLRTPGTNGIKRRQSVQTSVLESYCTGSYGKLLEREELVHSYSAVTLGTPCLRPFLTLVCYIFLSGTFLHRMSQAFGTMYSN